MSEKFNKSYSKNLTAEQIKLLNEWVLLNNNDENNLINLMKTAKIVALDKISNYKHICENATITEKIIAVRDNINNTNFVAPINESHVIKAMVMLEICNELDGDEND